MSNDEQIERSSTSSTYQGPYEIGPLIGEGGMARVFEGIHRQHGRLAAIKFPKGSPWAFARFRQEIEALERLDHPHVMPLLEVDRLRGWYAMPRAFCSLRDLRQRDPFAWHLLRKVLGSVSGAMMHAHSLGCIHRDASPDNIMRLPNGHWALSDFGIAQLRGPGQPRTETGALMGTPDFTAPEVRLEPSQVTTAADAWSIGALARWFTSIHKSHEPTSPAGRFWWTLIDSTMRLNPDDRWTLPQIATHLNAPPAVLAAVPVAVRLNASAEQCARCHDNTDRDAVGRCCSCGYMSED